MCWQSLNASESSLSRISVQGMCKREFLKTFSVAGLGAILSGCAVNAETGQSQLLLVSARQLNQLSAQSWADLKSRQPVLKDARYLNRLKTIGARIAQSAGRARQNWQYAVFDSDLKNAFVLPGNQVGFYRGMMDFADNEDQIAAVMGHEVGHVSAHHAQERMSQKVLGNLGMGLGTTLLGRSFGGKCATGVQGRNCRATAKRRTQLAGAALGLGFTYGVVLPYSRKHESQSDLLGAKYMYKAGYDPYEAVRLWEKMAQAQPSRQPAFLSTHPDPARRARDLHDYIRYQAQLGSQGWQTIALPKES